jgi:glutamate synthase (ferredoxin)
MTGGTIVVLGKTGRNFGAGMTGGVAYVFDEAQTLETRYNPQLIQLDRLSAQDEARVQRLLQRHMELTGSPRATEMLAHWDIYRTQFWRVMPRDAVAQMENSGASEAAKDKAAGGRRVAA